MATNYERQLIPIDSLSDKRRVWDTPADSAEEGLGRLVLLTPEVVTAAAAACIKTGRRVCLNWDMRKLESAQFGRMAPQHHITPLLDGIAFDDTYIFNPQQSSQWDGLRHHSGPGDAHSTDTESSRIYYGGTTAAQIQDKACHRIGMQHWAKDGMAGRGVLLDYVSYAERKNIKYSAFSAHGIPVRALQEIARDSNITFQRGDLVFNRVGVISEWETKMSIADKAQYAALGEPKHAGIEATEEMLRWIWDNGLVALASDAVSLEVFPDQKEYARPDGSTVPGLSLHAYAIAGWGMAIGELFDLERLSVLCKEMQRWDFFVTSAPLNMPGGVSSPPNCMAIF